MNSLLVLTFFLLVISSGASSEGVALFCVKPNASGICLDQGCQKCETLQYFFDNVNETINQHDNVTLVFMSGSHNVCVSRSISITASVLRMTGRNHNVTVTGVCDCHCDFSFSHIDSTLFVEDIEFVNYNSLGVRSDSSHGNAKSGILKGCSFHNSRIPTFSILIVEDCAFDTNDAFNIVYTAEFTNCSFFKCRITLDEGATAILKDCLVYYSPTTIINSSITIAGNSSIQYSTNQYSNFFAVSSNITLSDNISFVKNVAFYGGAMRMYQSTLNITANANVAFINNSAFVNGGAIYLYLSTISVAGGANLTFVNNSASDKGGAIYIYPGLTAASIFEFPATDNSFRDMSCFFEGDGKNYSIYFANNRASEGGDDVYGGAVCGCHAEVKTLSSGSSRVSSDQLRVCACENDKPQCNTHYNYTSLSVKVYPGESFTVPILLVGLEYGTTTGIVYTNILQPEGSHIRLDFNPADKYMISDHTRCMNLSYSLSSSFDYTPTNVVMYVSPLKLDDEFLRQILKGKVRKNKDLYACDIYGYSVQLMPIFFNVTLLPCPPGFSLMNERCDCYLHHKVFDDCAIINGTGYFQWSSNAWASVYEDGVLYNTHCPFDYCKMTTSLSNCPVEYCKAKTEQVDLENDSHSQCAFNRNGTLCGSCRENYSLAIGSSHCIQCHNNNNLALVIFFAAAGFILVFFITALNLTVSQGMINGLIFYANIVWTYQSVFFSPYQEGNSVLIFFKAFIAWVNLDFGIETCFISGLTAFWKTWLQFVFPFYIWVIAGLIIVVSRYSSKLTNLLGNRAVPVLDTLFLLSYMKLLRLVVTTLEFSYLKYTDQNSTITHSVVWSVDGNLSYFGYPHILLFLAGLATLVVLCLPYTMLLLSMQWLRRLPHSKLTNRIMKFHPVYDAYFAPLKHKHQYWFGVLLLARVILLLAFVSTFAVPQYVNLLLLLIVGAILTFYVAVVQPYKSTAILLLQSISFVNLNLLAGFVIVSSVYNETTLQTSAVGLSTGVAFVQFCGTVLYAVIIVVKSRLKYRYSMYRHSDKDGYKGRCSTNFYDSLDRDHVTNEGHPLLDSDKHSYM